jgi:hypothetical protein
MGQGATPGWWKDHQKVKHQRHEFFNLADLELTLTLVLERK